MTTRQELEKMVEVEVMREFNGTNCTASNRNAFLYGAAFVMDKLMPEIEKLNETNEESIDRAFQAEKNAALIAVEYTKIGCQLTAANERIKTLKAENQRIMEAAVNFEACLASLTEMAECRGDADCDHCVSVTVLEHFKGWNKKTPPERGEE